MADRRLFAKTIVDSDNFLEMPLSAHALYFHLGMRADDEGFVNAPKKIVRMIGAADDDLKALIDKRFILPFQSGVIVIKHWNINNSIRADRKKETVYQAEKAMLFLKPNGAYTLKNQGCNQMTTNCQPNDNQVATKCQPNDRISQSNISQDKIIQDNISQSINQSNINNINNNIGHPIFSRLTEEEWQKLADTYDDLSDLIDLIDDRLKLSSKPISNPFAYIVKVAQDERWVTK